MILQLINIADGIDGIFIENHRFSTTHISVNLYVPLKKETLALNALLPFVLTSSCEAYPDFSALNLRLCQLYGTQLGAAADKLGDLQLIKLFSFCVNDSLTPDGENVVEQAAELLAKMLFEPALVDGAFTTADVERERRLTLEKIEGLVNDKRAYAIGQILAQMYRTEAFGEYKTGSAKAVKEITAAGLYQAWRALLSTAQVRIQVIGSKLPQGLFARFAAGFQAFDRKPLPLAKTVIKQQSQTVNRVSEQMAVTQGKLVLGFTANRLLPPNEQAAVSVFTDLFGGGPYSKLFSNVREKMSLCYYCAARANRHKGYLLVDSGVEPQNALRAEQEICRQLLAVQQGDFSDEVLAASKRSLKDSLVCFNDSQAALDGWYSLLTAEQLLSPEEYVVQIEQVTREQVIQAANMYRLDTVYNLEPQKEEQA